MQVSSQGRTAQNPLLLLLLLLGLDTSRVEFIREVRFFELLLQLEDRSGRRWMSR